MKVLLVNGGPHEKGCTYTALAQAAEVLHQEGIETEYFWAGLGPIRGCTSCRACRKSPLGICVFDDDPVNRLIEAAQEADGFLFGSPVHYAGATGTMTSLMDRAFFAGGKYFAGKPGGCVVSCRRGGSTSTVDQLNKYLMINGMPLAASQYWNTVHGDTPDEVKQDAEGMQTMRVLAHSLAWLLKCIDAGAKAGITLDDSEVRVKTNFIR